MEDEAATDSEIEESASESSDDESADSESSDADSAEAEDRGQSGDEEATAAGGLFPNEPMMSFAETPDVDEALADMPERREDLFRSTCAELLDVPDGFEIVAFLPIEIAAEPAELFVLADVNGVETGLIVDTTCNQM